MEKTITLKDGSDVVLRNLIPDDVKNSIAFFQSLPDADRIYLRNDVMDANVVRRRIQEMERNREIVLVAISGDAIVADGSLELEAHGWKKHLGEIRLVVAPSHQRKGLGMCLARELYFQAASEKVQEIIVKMMRPQLGAQKIFNRLGFKEEMTLPRYVKDLNGHHQDLIIMRCDLKALWQQLEDYFVETDWERRK